MSVVFTILSAVFMGDSIGEDAVPIFFKSILFTIFEIIILINRKKISNSIGSLSIINSLLMIITSIGDSSLFGIVYLLLGILSIIHSIIYLNKYKKSDYNSEITNFGTKRNTKLRYLTLIANVLSLLFVFGFMSENIAVGIIVYATIILINICNIIFCIFLNKKYNESTFVYITMIISIVAFLINCLLLFDLVGSYYNKIKYNNSEAYVVDFCHGVESSINDNITLLENLSSLNVVIGENAIVQLYDYLSLDLYWIYPIDL